MRWWLELILAVAAGLFILGAVTIAALIGLNAECNGADCPRSDTWRATVVATPVATAILLLGGATWSGISRRLQPRVPAAAARLALLAAGRVALDDAGLGTMVLLAVAGFVGWRALGR